MEELAARPVDFDAMRDGDALEGFQYADDALLLDRVDDPQLVHHLPLVDPLQVELDALAEQDPERLPVVIVLPLLVGRLPRRIHSCQL